MHFSPIYFHLSPSAGAPPLNIHCNFIFYCYYCLQQLKNAQYQNSEAESVVREGARVCEPRESMPGQCSRLLLVDGQVLARLAILPYT
jgi:hypothetical protein